MKQVFLGALVGAAIVAPGAAIIFLWHPGQRSAQRPAVQWAGDHRQVLRVCPGGVLVVRDGPSLQVIRPRALAGWDVAPDATPESLCPTPIGRRP